MPKLAFLTNQILRFAWEASLANNISPALTVSLFIAAASTRHLCGSCCLYLRLYQTGPTITFYSGAPILSSPDKTRRARKSLSLFLSFPSTTPSPKKSRSKLHTETWFPFGGPRLARKRTISRALGESPRTSCLAQGMRKRAAIRAPRLNLAPPACLCLPLSSCPGAPAFWHIFPNLALPRWPGVCLAA